MSKEKQMYSLKGAFKKWCELTGDYESGIYVAETPNWFRVEILYYFSYTITKVRGKSKRFSKNYRYTFKLSDSDLLMIKTHSRDKFLQAHRLSNTHTFKSDYKKESKYEETKTESQT